MRRVVWGWGCAALSLVLSACWPVPGQNPDRTSYNSLEVKITQETVGDLEELWRYELPAGFGSGDRGSIVTSLDGVHVTAGCRVATLDTRTGATKWTQTIPTTDTFCEDPLGLSSIYVTGPHEFSSDGISQLIAGWGWVFPGGPPPGPEPQADWQSATFDTATGERLDSLGSSVMATRGADYASSYVSGIIEPNPPYLPVWTQTVHLGKPGLPGRSFRVTRSGSPTGLGVTKLTLGEDLVFHSGSGSLVTEPGMPGAAGDGVRAFSRDEARPGCSPVGGVAIECPVWATPTDGSPTTPVVGEGGDVVYARTPQTLYAIDSATGEVLWTAEGVGVGEPAVAEGLVYLPSSDGRVLVFDATGCGEATCEPVWEIDTGSGAGVSTPAIAGDVLYVASVNSVYAFSADGCGEPTCGTDTTLWAGAGETQPVVSFGQLYTFLGRTVIAYGLD